MAVIDVDKVRIWSVEFIVSAPLSSMPCPARIVMEREGKGYIIKGTPPPRNAFLHGGQLTITLGGRGILCTGKTRREVRAGDAFLYLISDPEVTYYYPEDSTEPWDFIWIHFEGGTSEQLIKELNQRYGYVFSGSGNIELQRKLCSFYTKKRAVQFLAPLEAAKLAADIFELLLRDRETKSPISVRNKLVITARMIIMDNIAKNFTASDIAAKLSVSREHLCKVFKEETGMTLHAYQLTVQLDSAMKLITRTRLSCKEIMQKCGFGSYSTFYRSFFIRYGNPPDYFRSGG